MPLQDSFFDTALSFVIRWEGGYSNNPADPGGATQNGITQRVFDKWNSDHKLPAKPVRDIDPDTVREIYREHYWNAAKCDTLPRPLGLVVFDTAVNCGVKQAQLFLAYQPMDYSKYLDLRANFYTRLVLRKPAMKVFLKGWLNRVEDLRREAKKYA